MIIIIRLVVAANPSEKWWSEFVSWDDFVPFPTEWTVMEKNVPSHQPVMDSSSINGPFSSSQTGKSLEYLQNLPISFDDDPQ